MPRHAFREAGPIRSALLVSTFALAGCSSGDPIERAGLSGLKPSAAWVPSDPARAVVPGRVLGSWSGPEGSSLVVYQTLPEPREDPRSPAGSWTESSERAAELRNRLENLPGLRMEKAGGAVFKHEANGPGRTTRASWVEAVAPGTGDRLAPSGLGKPIPPPGRTLAPTRRVSVGFRGRDATTWLEFHYPEVADPAIRPEIERLAREIRVRGGVVGGAGL